MCELELELGKVKKTYWVNWKHEHEFSLFTILSKAKPECITGKHDSKERYLNTLINVEITLLTS